MFNVGIPTDGDQLYENRSYAVPKTCTCAPLHTATLVGDIVNEFGITNRFTSSIMAHAAECGCMVIVHEKLPSTVGVMIGLGIVSLLMNVGGAHW